MEGFPGGHPSLLRIIGEGGEQDPTLCLSPVRRETTLVSLPGRAMRSGDVDQPRLRRVEDLLILESGVRFEWFQVFGIGFFDESDLSQVLLGQS